MQPVPAVLASSSISSLSENFLLVEKSPIGDAESSDFEVPALFDTSDNILNEVNGSKRGVSCINNELLVFVQIFNSNEES